MLDRHRLVLFVLVLVASVSAEVASPSTGVAQVGADRPAPSAPQWASDQVTSAQQNQAFVPLTPARLVDTRPSGQRVGAPDGTGTPLEITVTGQGGLPTTGIGAVALNVTVVDGQDPDIGGGYVTVYNCGTRPDASNLNFTTGQTIPNAVIAPVTTDGRICFYVYGTAHLLADTAGYFPADTGFTPLTPARLVDTRPSGQRVGAPDGTGTPLEITVTGQAGLPTTGIGAVALNVTVVDGQDPDIGGGYVTVYPCGTRPDASNLNFTTGQTIPNAVIAPVTTDGRICFYVYGTAHLLADTAGHFTGEGVEAPPPPPAAGVTRIAAGAAHTCGIDGGAATCWGQNFYGQIGDGTSYFDPDTGNVGDESADVRPTATRVVGLGSGVTAITAGGNHSCAVRNGAAWCWGENNGGQLGDGGTRNSPSPVAVAGLGSGVTAISAGGSHTCAIHNGAAKCWGVGPQNGGGDDLERTTPVTVTGLGSGVTSISAGVFHTCAVHNGAAKCWGVGNEGQLGDGSSGIRYSPVTVAGLGSGVTAVSVGEAHSCALLQGGSVRCWGEGIYGQLGQGSFASSLTPVAVSGMGSGVSAIAAGEFSTCAVRNGAARCWGRNDSGVLGDGTEENRATAVQVIGMTSGVTDVAVHLDASSFAQPSHSCAIRNGRANCWGFNLYGQLGDGTTSNDPEGHPPRPVVGWGG